MVRPRRGTRRGAHSATHQRALDSQKPKPRKDLKRTLRRMARNRVGKNVTHGRINPMAMLRIAR